MLISHLLPSINPISRLSGLPSVFSVAKRGLVTSSRNLESRSGRQFDRLIERKAGLDRVEQRFLNGFAGVRDLNRGGTISNRDFSDASRVFKLSKTPSFTLPTRNMSSTSQPEFANRLAKEKSPYLLQHAHNPVDWYPWSEEALELAKRENKPIFLSVGYATCHWCVFGSRACEAEGYWRARTEFDVLTRASFSIRFRSGAMSWSM